MIILIHFIDVFSVVSMIFSLGGSYWADSNTWTYNAIAFDIELVNIFCTEFSIARKRPTISKTHDANYMIEQLFTYACTIHLLSGSVNLSSRPNWMCFGTALSVNSSNDCNYWYKDNAQQIRLKGTRTPPTHSCSTNIYLVTKRVKHSNYFGLSWPNVSAWKIRFIWKHFLHGCQETFLHRIMVCTIWKHLN